MLVLLLLALSDLAFRTGSRIRSIISTSVNVREITRRSFIMSGITSHSTIRIISIIFSLSVGICLMVCDKRVAVPVPVTFTTLSCVFVVSDVFAFWYCHYYVYR